MHSGLAFLWRIYPIHRDRNAVGTPAVGCAQHGPRIRPSFERKHQNQSSGQGKTRLGTAATSGARIHEEGDMQRQWSAIQHHHHYASLRYIGHPCIYCSSHIKRCALERNPISMRVSCSFETHWFVVTPMFFLQRMEIDAKMRQDQAKQPNKCATPRQEPSYDGP